MNEPYNIGLFHEVTIYYYVTPVLITNAVVINSCNNGNAVDKLVAPPINQFFQNNLSACSYYNGFNTVVINIMRSVVRRFVSI